MLISDDIRFTEAISSCDFSISTFLHFSVADHMGQLSVEHSLAGGLRDKLNLLQYFPPVKNDKQRRVDRQLAM